MRGLNFLTPRQFQDAMIGTCRQVELTDRHPHQTLTFVLQLAKLPYLPGAHIGVTDDVGGAVIREMLLLNIRAACTRPRIAALDSPTRSPLNFS